MPKGKRGFAKMNPKKQKEIAKEGGETRKEVGADYSELGSMGAEARWGENNDGEGFEQTNMDIFSSTGEDSDDGEEGSKRGMGSPNYPQDVAENAREEGGRNSLRGGDSSDDE